MTIAGVVKMIWNKVTGKDVSADVINAESRIDTWRKVYRGTPEWLDYWYPTLKGKMQKRVRKTMKPAKILCSEIAGLIWAERPKLTTDERVQKVLDDCLFFDNAQRESELMLALGATIPKAYRKDGKIGIDWVQADRFIPVTWDDSVITEADIIDRRVINKKQYVRIERHRKNGEGYTITSDCFEEVGSLLVPAPLAVFGLEDAEQTSPVKLFHYIGNPEANNLDTDSPLSISCFANALDTIESLDIAFDALQSEIVLGKKRIIVPAGAVRYVMNAETGKAERYFDPSDEVFQAFSTDDKDNLKITDNTVEMRIEEIRRAIQTLLDILAIQTGLNPGSISFDGAGMKTATEVISENSKTFKTKKGYENAIGTGIIGLCKTIRGLLEIGDGDDSIEWDDSVIEDRASKTNYVHGRLTGGTVSRWRAIMILDGVDEAEAKKRAAEIEQELAVSGMGGLFE